MKKNIKTAVVGIGNMGKNHARIYKQISHLTAVVDINGSRGKKMADEFDVKWYKTIDELLKYEQIDALSVVVPTKFHYQVASESIKRGIPTLVEKPITESSSQAKKLIALAKKKKVFLQVGHIERFNPAITKIKSLIDKNRLGQIVSLLALRVGISPPKSKNSDVSLDLCIHDIDIMNYLLGEYPTEVNIAKKKIFKNNLADAASILMQYKHATGMIQANWITPIKIRKLYVTGTEGFAEVDYIHQKVTMYDKLINIKASGNFYELVSRYDTSKKEVHISRKEPLKEELKYFLKHRNTQKPDQIAYDALETLLVVNHK